MKKVYTVREGIIVEIASIRYPELCAKNHPPIIHSELACPLCEMQEDIDASEELVQLFMSREKE
jgi:hypothetical protein